MSIHDTLERLAGGGRGALESLARRYEDGDLEWDEFLALAVTDGARRRSAATGLADLAVSAEVSKLARQVKAPSGVLDDDDPAGHVRAAIIQQTTTASYAADPVTAMGIAGAALVMAAYQEATNRAMRDQMVEYYRRDVEPNACVICEDMDDIVLPVSHEAWHHTGCRCVSVPVSVNND